MLQDKDTCMPLWTYRQQTNGRWTILHFRTHRKVLSEGSPVL